MLTYLAKSEMSLEASLLEDLRGLVEFALAGLIAGASDRLFRTPSAITGKFQRRRRVLCQRLNARTMV